MNSRYLMPIFALVGFALSAPLTSNESFDDYGPQFERDYESAPYYSAPTYFDGYANQPCCDKACSDESCSGVTLYGEYLYWRAVQDEMQYASVLPGGLAAVFDEIISAIINGTPINISNTMTIIDPKFEFKSGFRIGLGYDMPCSNWDFQAKWTRLHEEISSSVADLTGGIFPVTVPISSLFGFIGLTPVPFSFATAATSRWKFQFDTIDLEIGKRCKASCIIYRPYVGIKLAQIKQDQNIQYFGFSVGDDEVLITNHKHNKFRGIGPSIGVDTFWEFACNWFLSGGIEGALLCNKIDAFNNPTTVLAPNSFSLLLVNSKHHRLNPTVNANIGIDWQINFCNRFKLTAGVAYEVQYWWNQWLVPVSEVTGIIGGGLTRGDLMLYGLTARFGLGF